MKKKLDFKVLAIMGVVVFSACGSVQPGKGGS